MASMKAIKIIPYICGVGGSVKGAEQGAIDLQDTNLVEDLQGAGLDVSWHEEPRRMFEDKYGARAHEEYPDLGTAARKEIALYHCARIREHVAEVIAAGDFPLTIGGDHSMAAGSIAGLAKAKGAYGRVGVLWIDAHADLNTMDTSPSKALHGMPVASLLGMGDAEYVAVCGDEPVLKPENIFYLGLRDVDRGEKGFMEKLGIKGYTAAQSYEMGLKQALADAMDAITKDTDYLFLTFDLDSLDPQDAPATGTPVPEGFRADDLLPLLKDLVQQYDFDAIEISEYNPTLEGRDKTRALVDRLCQTFLAFAADKGKLQAAS